MHFHRKGERHQGCETQRVQADPDAARNRRNEAPSPRFREVTEHDNLVAACVQLLEGTSNPVKVFGMELLNRKVEFREEEGGFNAIVFWDAEHDETSEVQIFDIVRQGFYIPATKVMNAEKARFKNFAEEAFTLSLYSHKEMQEAITRVRAAQAEQKKTEVKKTTSFIESLREKAFTKAVPATKPPTKEAVTSTGKSYRSLTGRNRPMLESLKDILVVSDGIIEYDGCTIMVCWGGNQTVVRIKKAPEGHPMYELYKRNLAVHQNSLHHLDESEVNPGDEKAELHRKMRDYLRNELVKAGVNLMHRPTAEAKSNGNDAYEENPLGKALGAETSLFSS